MQPQASGTGQPPEQDNGVRVSLSELIDIRHRVREVPLFSTHTGAARWWGCIIPSCAAAAWISIRCASTRPAMTCAPSTGG